jgi:hypothetical protein
MLAPSIDEGYYVLLQPLSTGQHTIVFENVKGSDENCSADLKVTYHLTVE